MNNKIIFLFLVFYSCIVNFSLQNHLGSDNINNIIKDGYEKYMQGSTGDNTNPVNNVDNKPRLRLLFNTSLITGQNDKYACYKVGDKVVFEGYSADTSCPEDMEKVTPPCIYTCTEKDIQNSESQRLIKNLLPLFQQIFSDSLSVRNPKPNLVFNETVIQEDTEDSGQCGFGNFFPDSYFNEGVNNTDMVIFVNMRPTGGSLAYASRCTYDSNGRPTGGYINFNPSTLLPFFNQTSLYEFDQLSRTGLHEVIHALGFSKAIFDKYIDESTGKPYINGVVKNITRNGITPSGESYEYSKLAIILPSVVKFVREHFNCPTIEYAELEDGGGKGTSGSHWEKRIFGGEILGPDEVETSIFSNLTLALLKDTGWYDVNFTNAEPLEFGKNLGCAWLDNCKPDTWNYQGYFCTDDKSFSCSATRTGKFKCNVEEDDDIPLHFQHFKNKKLGGNDTNSDYCPFYDFNKDTTTLCIDSSNQHLANRDIGETYCIDCKCFEYQTDDKGTISQACWEQRCDQNTVQLKVKGDWVSCPNGQTISFNNVTLVCPIGYTLCGGTGKTIVVQSIDSIYNSNSVSSNLITMSIAITFLILSLLIQ